VTTDKFVLTTAISVLLAGALFPPRLFLLLGVACSAARPQAVARPYSASLGQSNDRDLNWSKEDDDERSCLCFKIPH
jgi:hypothetical protein